MNKIEMANYLDHAVLDPSMSIEELKQAIMIGVNNKCKTVCVNSAAIDIAKACLKESETKLCVVCDFPFGSSSLKSKLAQVQAIIDEKDISEIDLVGNYGLIKSGKLSVFTKEINEVTQLCHHNKIILKVIIETDALTKDEIVKATKCCIAANADFVKTSTCYFKSDTLIGADPEVIELIVKTADNKIKVKGSGCIRSQIRLLELIDLGIDRAGVGYKSTEKILNTQSTVESAY
ncbi:MAG: deoxyribose-phosphate aldolase [Erysipelotrichaceae bacterium]